MLGIRSVPVAFVLAISALCSASFAQTIRYLSPTFTRASTANLVYGANSNPWTSQIESLKLDVHEPSGDTLPARPVYIHVHRGRSTTGSKFSTESVLACDAFATRGFVALAIDYRTSTLATTGELDANVCAEDIKSAIRWARKNAATYRLDPTRIMIGGHSEGATGAFTAAFTSWDGNSGNAGFDSQANAMVDLWGNTLVSLDATNVGLLLVHGTADTVVPFARAKGIEAEAKKNKLAKLVPVTGGGHEMWASWSQFEGSIIGFAFEALRLYELEGLTVPVDYKTGPTAKLQATGWQTNIAFFLLAPATGNVPFPPYGTLLLDPVTMIPLGGIQHPTTSLTNTVTLPLPVPPGMQGTLYAQVVWFSSSYWWFTYFSNRVTLTWP